MSTTGIVDDNEPDNVDLLDIPEIKESYEKFVEFSNNLLAKGIEFVKWTTTISIAAIVWIATSINTNGIANNFFLNIAIICFISAIIIALFIVYYVLTYWAWQTKAEFSRLKFLIGKEEKHRESLGLTMPKVLYFLYEHQKSNKKVLIYQQPDNFTILIALHMIAIISGLIFYLKSLVPA